jgi:hypothetical protein
MTTRSCPYGGVSCDRGRHGTAQEGSPPGGLARRQGPLRRRPHHTEPQTHAALTDPDLDKKARELCAGPPAKWRKVLERRFGIASITGAVDWDRLDLLWQDRNAMAHRGAVVDARHNSATGTAIGTILDPSPDEVKSAIDDVGAARYGIVTAVWDHLVPGMGAKLAAEIWVSLWDSLRADRRRLAHGLARVEETLARDSVAIATAWPLPRPGHCHGQG